MRAEPTLISVDNTPAQLLDGQGNLPKSKLRQEILQRSNSYNNGLSIAGPDHENVGMLLSRPKNLANPLPSYEHMAHTHTYI